MLGTVERIVDRLSVKWLLISYILWIAIFGIAYYLLPLFDPTSGSASGKGEIQKGFADAMFFSFGIGTNSDVSGLLPSGHAKWLSVVEVSGGILFAGLAINLLAIMPSKRTRVAERACRGWWMEEITIKGVQKFYSISNMTRCGDALRKNGRNYHPNGGQMDGTTYNGRLSTYDFPVIISQYLNSTPSKEYTNGFLRIEMNMNSDGSYNSYTGMCFDQKYGGRDQIVGRRITHHALLEKLETGGQLTNKEHDALVFQFFNSNPPPVESGESSQA